MNLKDLIPDYIIGSDDFVAQVPDNVWGVKDLLERSKSSFEELHTLVNLSESKITAQLPIKEIASFDNSPSRYHVPNPRITSSQTYYRGQQLVVDFS